MYRQISATFFELNISVCCSAAPKRKQKIFLSRFWLLVLVLLLPSMNLVRFIFLLIYSRRHLNASRIVIIKCIDYGIGLVNKQRDSIHTIQSYYESASAATIKTHNLYHPFYMHFFFRLMREKKNYISIRIKYSRAVRQHPNQMMIRANRIAFDKTKTNHRVFVGCTSEPNAKCQMRTQIIFCLLVVFFQKKI